MALSKGPVLQFSTPIILTEIFAGLFGIVIDLHQAPAVDSVELYDTITSDVWPELCQQTEGPSHPVLAILPLQGLQMGSSQQRVIQLAL